ncbi:Polysaccharide pyruvyl transferase family protein WcaK [Amycolatopsis marina]|uniref:Polysaccharide pyruvyl transferase family protein WcaK n=1 Tax=Amycolatopsis marina TaxID=490629 RepID=A0A1I0XD51_9PSEU|nr:polysaccharide pyruvyl transferase family protein [Amycolatopsis marina]SFA98250.1 Polysaccharide pyruvyl transferase family protein WcaK [Amycolatopsis marina]
MTGPRIGLFGLFGSGNMGNDGSLDAVLSHLRGQYPDAVFDCLCPEPEEVTRRFAIPATQLHWYDARPRPTSNIAASALKVVGKIADLARTVRWTRRFDVVIVPGMGVLETTLPLRPWGFPYALFLLCASGKLVGTRVALVNVGANVIGQRLTRWLSTSSARLAYYRSFRDALSRQAMREMGVDTSRDLVYPDLVYALPAPEPTSPEPGTIGVGVMDFHGGNDDREHAGEIRSNYADAMVRFVHRLLDAGHGVRLFTGDRVDEVVVAEILGDVCRTRSETDSARVIAEPVTSLPELMRQMTTVDSVVGTRYHNVVCAVKLGKPTISISYSAKSDQIMIDMGLGEFCQSARAVDVELLMKQLDVLEKQREQLRRGMLERGAEYSRELERQFRDLCERLFPGTEGTFQVEEAR